MLATVTLVITTVILLVVFLVIRNSSKKDPPGPISWLFIGNQFLLSRLTQELGGLHLAFAELCKRHGSGVITVRTGINKVLIVSESKLVQKVLKDEDYDGRPWNEFIKLRNLGKKQGITMNDGPEWKEVRAWIMQTLKAFGFGKHSMAEMIKDELTMVLENLQDGGAKRLKPLINTAVLNVLWTLATGKRFDKLEKLQYLTNLMDRRTRIFDMVGGLLSAFPWIRYIAPEASGYNLLVTLNNEFKDFLMETIIEHKKKYVPGNENDLIDMFLREMLNKDPNPIFNEDQLVMILIDLFLAGSVTTGTTLDFIFMAITVHQDVQRKLHEEIDSVIPSDRLPILEDREKLHYTQAVILEAFRMWPPFPVIGPRRVTKDTHLNEYTIPKGTTVLINMASYNLDPVLYPDPNTYKPERFMKNGIFEADSDVLMFGRVEAKKGFGPGEQEWGYVEVRPRAHMFWWLYFTNANVSSFYQKPLVIWLQGGPGASSTSYGNFEELGPLDVDLKYRSHTWVKDYNVLFIDNPVGTGYSYVTNRTQYAQTNAQIASDLVECMRGFLKKLPRFANVSTYITTESYGGKMGAEFALAWYKAQKEGSIKSNLKGVALGDAWISPVDSTVTWAPYLLATGMVDTAGYEEIDRSAQKAKVAAEQGNWRQSALMWSYTEGVISKVTNNIDFYNILTKMRGVGRQYSFQSFSWNPTPNRADDLTALMNGPVKQALGLSVEHGAQSGQVWNMLLGDFMKPVINIVEQLLDQTNLKVIVLSGQLDLIVDTPGTLQWVEKMKWKNSNLWLKSVRRPLIVNGIIEGYVKSYGNLAMYWVNRAGHMVPKDNPDGMAKILQDMTNNAWKTIPAVFRRTFRGRSTVEHSYLDTSTVICFLIFQDESERRRTAAETVPKQITDVFSLELFVPPSLPLRRS
ncbi:uncharacterized protein LOC143188395 [Calliopsis andreniformis]|uniref:uncharacterized protein LOC143188395 n=1 Tax=Calliopsis andreniformis TaxID=337506 RepID=UPI003FCDE211